MTTRRTVFQPDLEVELPEDEEALLERDRLLLPIVEDAKPAKAGATVTASAPSREAPSDGGK
jgi:hypothetical protein